MFDPIKILSEATLTGTLPTNVATTCTVLAGQGASKFPTLSGSQAFNAMLWDSTLGNPTDDPNAEAVRITLISTDTLTMTRAQEGTAAVAHNTAGHIYKIGQFISLKMMQDIAAGAGDYAVDTGIVNAYACTPIVYPTALTTGISACVKITNTNTSALAPTLNVAGLGAIAILRQSGGVPSAGEIVAGKIYVFTYDGASWILQSPVGLRSEIWLQGGNGEGGTNTCIRRFTTVVKNVGNAMTLTQSAANGDSVTINEDGLYSIMNADYSTTTGIMNGVSLNSAQLTTAVSTITASTCIAIGSGPAGNFPGVAQVTLKLSVGDVVRAHTNSASTPSGTTGNMVQFRITKVSD